MKLCELPGERPATDDDYFEVMTKAIFTAGLNWRVIEVKWPAFRRAFHDFSIAQVARMTPEDVDRLAGDRAIVRNYRKIAATVENARCLAALIAVDGSVEAYLDSLRSQGEDAMIAALGKQFAFLGPGSARGFLAATGHLRPAHQAVAAAAG